MSTISATPLKTEVSPFWGKTIFLILGTALVYFVPDRGIGEKIIAEIFVFIYVFFLAFRDEKEV